MMIVFASIISILVILEYVTRKLKIKIDSKDEVITREVLEENLEGIESLQYTYGKVFACHLEDLNLILIPKETYVKSDQLMVMHEIGHFFHFSRIKDTSRFKVLIYSKGVFYILGIMTMFSMIISLIFNPFFYVLKYLLILLIAVQMIHFILLAYSEYVANTYIYDYFNQGKDAMLYAYASMLSQMFYWLLLIVLTIGLYQFMFL